MRAAGTFRPGDLVRVRSLQEIGATLDKNGTLEFLPFMPEMVPFAGKRFKVHRRLEKTCVEGYSQRTLAQTVTLEGLYCNGSSHDGCQRLCPLLWKEAWLRRADESLVDEPEQRNQNEFASLLKTTRDDEHYFCQSTELFQASSHLPTISFDRCTLEWRSGNVGLAEAARYLWVPLVVQVKTRTLGLASVQPVGDMNKTPDTTLNLRPGELVEVRRPEEIAATVDRQGQNRGLRFTSTMVPFCGRRYTVRGRADRIIVETTGAMASLKNTVILDDVVCDGHTFLGGCSRLVFHLWREAWLKRVEVQR